MDSRFPDEVTAALQRSGWHPGRRQDAQAMTWAEVLTGHQSPDGYGHAVFPAAVEAWAEFGGLRVDLDGLDDAGYQLARTPFTIDPLLGLHQPRTLADLGRALAAPVAPLGAELDDRALLAIDAGGRVYSLDHTGEWHLGDSIDAAITTLVMGAIPRRLRLADA